MIGWLVAVAVVVALTTRTRRQRKAWMRLLAGCWWLVLLPLSLLLPGSQKQARNRAAGAAGLAPGSSTRQVIHDLDPTFLPRSKRVVRRKYAPGDERPGQGPRFFTHEQKQELLRIAGHRCQRVTAGWRCTATTRLEADHRIPYSWGGFTTIRNGQILCSHHNDAKGAKFADPGGEGLPPPWLRKRGKVRS